MTFSRPDITPAQIIAVVGGIIGLCVAAGLPISQELQDSIINFTTVVAGLLIAGDAGIRIGRSQIAKAEVMMDGLQTPLSADVPVDVDGSSIGVNTTDLDESPLPADNVIVDEGNIGSQPER